MSNELKELAEENLWYINNRWGGGEQQEQARIVAQKLLALAGGERVERVEIPEVEETIIDVTPPESFTPPGWLIDDDTFPIVGRRFEKGEFIEYVKWVQENESYQWSPNGITMHHTAYPDLSMRPNGFTEQHMKNIRHGYVTDRGWKRGPHIFTDDVGIWVFNPLSRRGIHAVSFNSHRYGIEMLGNFDTDEDFDDVRGLESMANGKFAAATLMKYAGISTAKLNFHRHDRETRKSCPGSKIDFTKFEDDVLDLVDKI